MWGLPSGAHKILCSAVLETGVGKMLDKHLTPDLVLWPSNGNYCYYYDPWNKSQGKIQRMQNRSKDIRILKTSKAPTKP